MTCAFLAVASAADAGPNCRKHKVIAASAMEVAPSDELVADKKAQRVQWKKNRMMQRQERRQAYIERKKTRQDAGAEGKKQAHAKRKAWGLNKGRRFGGKPFFVDAQTAVSLEEQEGTKEKPFATLEQALAKATVHAQKGKGKVKNVRIILNSGTYAPVNGNEELVVNAPMSLTIATRGDVTIAKPILGTVENTDT